MWHKMCCLYTEYCTAAFLHWGYCVWIDLGVGWHSLTVCGSSDDDSDQFAAWHVTVYPQAVYLHHPVSTTKEHCWCDEKQVNQDHNSDVLESLTKNKHQRIAICLGESHKWHLQPSSEGSERWPQETSKCKGKTTQGFTRKSDDGGHYSTNTLHK